MLTLKDCIAFCDLTEDEVKAIAEHERVPEIVAIELGQCLFDDGLVAAPARGDDAQATEPEPAMRRFGTKG